MLLNSIFEPAINQNLSDTTLSLFYNISPQDLQAA